MINMSGKFLRPMYVSSLDGCVDEPISFDVDSSYWPTSLKVDDPFDTDFKLVVDIDAISENRDVFIGVRYKGKLFGMYSWEDVPPNSKRAIEWADKPGPTIGELIEDLGGSITETTTVHLDWITGYVVSYEDDSMYVCITDEVGTDIYVEVPGTDWMMIAVAAGIIIGVAAIGYSVLKKPSGVRT